MSQWLVQWIPARLGIIALCFYPHSASPPPDVCLFACLFLAGNVSILWAFPKR